MQEEQQANAQQVASTCEWRFNLYAFAQEFIVICKS